jgi:ATP-dependent protease HslVU (ClpYQ) peptidase subunit
MTVIAFDGRKLAADTLTHANDIKMQKVIHKIQALDNGLVVSSAGTCSNARAFVEWCKNDCIKEKYPSLDESFQGICIKSGIVSLFDKTGLLEENLPVPVALGSGRELALGALEAGADAERAVQIAIAYDINCGGPVDVILVGE